MSHKPHFRWNAKRRCWQQYYNNRFRVYYLGACKICARPAVLGLRTGACRPCMHEAMHELAQITAPVRTAVSRAKRDGLIPRLDGSQKCVDCGRAAQVYDHRDYAKPLQVDPVCKKCNNRRGSALQAAMILLGARREAA